MSSFSLPARYQSYLGANFFQRQIKSVADALPGVIRRGLSQSPTAPPPASTGLPDMSAVDKPKMNLPLYLGIAGAGVVLLLALSGRKSQAPKAA